MTAVNVTAEALIASVRRRAMIPVSTDQNAFPTDADLLAMLNEEVESWLVPFILRARAGHYLTSVDLPLVANQASYLIPQRAAGDDVSFVQIVDSTGLPTQPALMQEDIEIAAAYPYNQAAIGTPILYYFLGNQVMLAPAPSFVGQFLRIWYPQRPNQLVAATSVAPITGVTQVGANFQVAFSGTAPATFLNSIAYECAHAQPGFEVVALGTANATAASYIQFPGTFPSGINVGDQLCLQDTANVVTNTPADLMPLLCQWVAIKCIEYRGSEEQLARAEQTFQATEKRALDFLGKRDQLAHRKIVPNRNRRRWTPFTVR